MSFSKSVLALSLLAALGTAQASVVKAVSGNTTTYTENFNNNATSFSAGEFNVPGTTDDYLWLGASQQSSWSFTTATALQSVTISFAYSVPAADSGYFKFASNSAVALPDTSGNALQFLFSNPSSTASADSFDGMFNATYTNLARGTYTLTFSTGPIDCGSLGSLKVDDLKVTTVAAVPEPETYALMAAGLVAVLFMARRRTSRHE